MLLRAALLASAVAIATPALAQPKTTLNFGMSAQDIGQLDPHFAVSTIDRVPAALMFNGLVRFAPGSADPATLEADLAEGRSWFGEPSSAELIDWEPVLDRAGVKVGPHRVAAAYLELAVLVRALEGLASTVRWQSTIDAGSLWAGLFDLRENLLGRALDDLRAIAA